MGLQCFKVNIKSLTFTQHFLVSAGIKRVNYRFNFELDQVSFYISTSTACIIEPIGDTRLVGPLIDKPILCSNIIISAKSSKRFIIFWKKAHLSYSFQNACENSIANLKSFVLDKLPSFGSKELK